MMGVREAAAPLFPPLDSGDEARMYLMMCRELNEGLSEP